jgi:hypothetical protein
MADTAVSPIGEVYATTDAPTAASVWHNGYCFNATNQLHISTTPTAGDFYISGRRFNPNGALVVGVGDVGNRPYWGNNGFPYRLTDDGLVFQANQTPAPQDPYVRGIRVGLLGGVYMITGGTVLPPEILSEPVILPPVQQGTAVSATSAVVSNGATLTQRRWYVAAVQVATTATYTPVAGDVGKELTYQETWTNSAGSVIGYSPPANVAALPVSPPTVTTQPTITDPDVSVVCVATSAVVTNGATLTSRHWYVDLVEVATTATYTPTMADYGKTLHYEERWDNSAGFVIAVSVGKVVANVFPQVEFDFMAGTLDSRLTFTRTGTNATYFDENGVMQTAGTNVPRFDHDPVTLELKGLLIEDANTNLFLNSDVPVDQTVNVTAVQHALSFYGTGSIALSGAHTATLVGTGAYPVRTTLVFTPTAGPLVMDLTGDVQKVQLETNYQASSYVATTGATATRARDQLMWSDATFISTVVADTGTVQAEVITSAVAPAATLTFALGTNAFSAERRIAVENQGASTTVRALSVSSPVGIGSRVVNALGKFIAGFDIPNAVKKGCSNGQAVSSIAYGTVPTVASSRLVIGAAGNFGTPIFGWVQKVRYWTTYLADDEMQAWTGTNEPTITPLGCLNYFQPYDYAAGPAAWVVQNRPPANARLEVANNAMALSGVGRYRMLMSIVQGGANNLPKNDAQRLATIRRMVGDGLNMVKLHALSGTESWTGNSFNWGIWQHPIDYNVIADRPNLDANALIALDKNIADMLAEGIEVIYIAEELLENVTQRNGLSWGSNHSRGMLWSPTFNAMEWAMLSAWMTRPSSISGIAPINNPRIFYCMNNENGFSNSYLRDTLTVWGGSTQAYNWFDKLVDGIVDDTGDNGEWYPELNAELTAWRDAFQPGWTIPNWGRGGAAGFPKRSTWASWGNAADKDHLLTFIQFCDIRYIEQMIDQLRAIRSDVVIVPGTFSYQSPAAQLALGPIRGTNIVCETHNYFQDADGAGVKQGTTHSRYSCMNGSWGPSRNGMAWGYVMMGTWGDDQAYLAPETGQYSPNRWRYQRVYYEAMLSLMHDYDFGTFEQSQQYSTSQYLTDGRYMTADSISVASPSDRLVLRAVAPAVRFGFLASNTSQFTINQTLASLKVYQDANDVTTVSSGVQFQSGWDSNGSEHAQWGGQKVRFNMDEGQSPTTNWTAYPRITDAQMTSGVYARNTATEKLWVQFDFGMQISSPYMCGFVDTITETPKFTMPMTITNLGADATGYVCFLRSDGLWNLFAGAMKLYIHGSDLSTNVVNQNSLYLQSAPSEVGVNDPPGADYFNANDNVQVWYQAQFSQSWGNNSSDKRTTWIRVPPSFTLNLTAPVDLVITGVAHDGTTEVLPSMYSGGVWSFDYDGRYVEFLVTLA